MGNFRNKPEAQILGHEKPVAKVWPILGIAETARNECRDIPPISGN
jgi:hypothetical protein